MYFLHCIDFMHEFSYLSKASIELIELGFIEGRKVVLYDFIDDLTGFLYEAQSFRCNSHTDYSPILLIRHTLNHSVSNQFVNVGGHVGLRYEEAFSKVGYG